MLETLLRRLDMVRLTVTATALVLAMGCSGLVDDGGTGGLTPAEAAARQAFIDKALPALASCGSCHESMAGIDFMNGGGDLAKRDTLLAYEPAVVNIDSPRSSRLLTKGQHAGPPLDAIQTSGVLEWLELEREALGGGGTDPSLRTEPVLVQLCQPGELPNETTPNPLCPINVIPLDAVGEGAAGGKVSFVVQALSSGLYFTNLKVVPGATGVFMEHPLFVALGEDGAAPRKDCELLDEATGAVACADLIDRFFSTKVNIEAAAPVDQQLLNGGAHTFVNFRPTDKIAIHFKAVKPFQAETTPPVAGGCKQLALFKGQPQSAFQGTGLGVNCQSCHAGANANATLTMNISQIASTDDAQLQLTCNQILSRVNLQNFDTSSVFLAVDPANANHPVRFNATDFQTFKNRIIPWITAERDAP